MRDYQESVTTGQTDGQTDAGQSDRYMPLCFAGDTTTDLRSSMVVSRLFGATVIWLLLNYKIQNN